MLPQQLVAQATCLSSVNKNTKISIVRIEEGCVNEGSINAKDEAFCAQLQLQTSSESSTSVSSYKAECIGHVSDPEYGYFSCSGFNGPWAILSIAVSGDKSYGASLILVSDQKISVIKDGGQCVESE